MIAFRAFINSRKLSWLLRLLLICGGDVTCGGGGARRF